MRVTALKRGYFGKLREAGETFDVPEGTKASWFAALHDNVPGPVAPEPVLPTPLAPKVGRPRKSTEPVPG